MRLANVLGILFSFMVVWILWLWLLSPWLEPTTWSLWEAIKIVGAGGLVAGISLTVAAVNERADAATFILLLIPVPLFGFILAAGSVRGMLLDEHQQRQAASAKVIAAQQLQEHPAPAKASEPTVAPSATTPSPTAKPTRVRGSTAAPKYPWLGDRTPTRTLETAVPPPAGFTRIELEGKGFGAWLRGLPMLPEGSPVLLWTGAPKPRQDQHVAVVDLDVGNQNLQQCADAVIRLRAEYLWAMGRASHVNQLPANPKHWEGGVWKAFRRHLNGVMAMTGSASMDAHMKKAPAGHRLQPGDVLVQGGFPGHAVMVLDAADNAKGERAVLIGQSYMPAQQFHVVVNARESAVSPWLREAALDEERGLKTPSWWPFRGKDVRIW
ncbi:MAG: hypothetical protein EXR79_16940 [Myxococcales bacterium]|nr:hypothetical protein [Myxococcales bacterium]